MGGQPSTKGTEDQKGSAQTCEGLVESIFLALIEPSFVDVMHELLSEVPGPHLFDGNGVTSPCSVGDIRNYQSGQRVTIYADLDC